jgi:hypothetical protein
MDLLEHKVGGIVLLEERTHALGRQIFQDAADPGWIGEMVRRIVWVVLRQNDGVKQMQFCLVFLSESDCMAKGRPGAVGEVGRKKDLSKIQHGFCPNGVGRLLYLWRVLFTFDSPAYSG